MLKDLLKAARDIAENGNAGTAPITKLSKVSQIAMQEKVLAMKGCGREMLPKTVSTTGITQKRISSTEGSVQHHCKISTA